MTQPNPLANQPVDEFELMRRRLQARGAVQAKGAQGELTRQFAALGNLPSGAALRVRQQAAEQTQRLTNEAVQDVNIAEAQTRFQEREAEKGRLAQRGIAELQAQTQTGIAGLQARSQTGIAGLQARSQEKIAQGQFKSAFDIAQLGAQTDLKKAEMAGANAIELANIQAETQSKIAQLSEAGMDKRLAIQIASNRELFDLEMAFKRDGQSLQEEMFAFSKDQAQQEMALNKAATSLNSIDPLMAMGFSGQEIKDMLSALDLPFADKIGGIIDQKEARMANQPPAPRQPSQEEKFTNAVGGAPQNYVDAVNTTLDKWFGGTITKASKRLKFRR